mgnify:CR=1 FL=1
MIFLLAVKLAVTKLHTYKHKNQHEFSKTEQRKIKHGVIVYSSLETLSGGTSLERSVTDRGFLTK